MGDACWLAGPPREGDAAGICGDAGGANCRPSNAGATRLVRCLFCATPGREGVMLDSGAIDEEGASLSDELGTVVPLPLARPRAAEPEPLVGAVMAAAARRWLGGRTRRRRECTCDAARVGRVQTLLGERGRREDGELRQEGTTREASIQHASGSDARRQREDVEAGGHSSAAAASLRLGHHPPPSLPGCITLTRDVQSKRLD
jgi:hypothetical protein